MYKEKKIFAYIPARGNSKRIPRKNMKLLDGKPLIYYTIKEAQNSQHIDKLIVSSEDKEIRKYAESLGCESWDREKGQSEDSYGAKELAYRFFDTVKPNYDYLVVLQPTSPFRTSIQIDKAIEKIINTGADVITGVYPLTGLPWWSVQLDKQDWVNYLYPELSGVGINSVGQKQNVPKAYGLTGHTRIYKWGKTLDSKKTIAYIADEISGLDIDTELDFMLAETIVNNRRENG